MKGRMLSIRTKVTALTVVAILLSVLLVGGIAIAMARQNADRRSAELMNLTCSSKCDEINHFLSFAEEGVSTVSRFAYESLDAEVFLHTGIIGATGSGRSLRGHEPTPSQQTQIDTYFEEYISRVQDIFEITARSNPHVLTYYMRINPELSRASSGFWYSKQSSPSFEPQELTNIKNFDVNDIAHVGWYYQPIERGRPSWLDPYFNDNMGKTIISYVAPLYRFGTYVGIIGVDVDFSDLTERIGEIKVLETGYAFLTDGKGKIVYHPQLSSGLLLAEVNTELEAAKHSDKSAGPISYRFNGISKKAVWGTLENGLTLIVSAPLREINWGWYTLSLYIIITAAGALILFTLIATSLTKRIIKPIERLAEASKRLALGDYSLKLEYEGNDEVGVLTQSFMQMERELHAFISDLNSKAYRDDLTGVKNKAALSVYIRKLDDAITSTSKPPRFALIVFDCNNLKLINDKFGHEQGDSYLKAACSLICSVYAHSPVFRMGGDEFVTILTLDDLDHIEELQRRFEERVCETNAQASAPWEMVDIARGQAIFDAEHDKDVSSVMRRADVAMYENKREMKGAGKRG